MERYLNLWAESLPQLLASTVAVTIPLSLISFAVALLVGIVSAGARTSRFAPVNWLAWLYIWVFRGPRCWFSCSSSSTACRRSVLPWTYGVPRSSR